MAYEGGGRPGVCRRSTTGDGPTGNALPAVRGWRILRWPNRGSRLARRALPADSPRVGPGYAANRGQRILLHREAAGGNPLLAWRQ